MEIKVGQMLASATDSTVVIVVRAAGDEAALTHGGKPMLASGSEAAHSGTPAPAGDGTLLGKRYVDEHDTLELLCTKPGPGILAVDGIAMTAKAAKALPTSD